MHDSITERLRDYNVVSVDLRRKWWITLKWYFGFCARNDLGDPGKRENGKLFWKDSVLKKNPEEWQKEQWAMAMKWFFQEIVEKDRAGAAMRSCIRRRHLAYTTEKSYMSWLRRFQTFLNPAEVMDCNEEDVVRFLTYLAEERQIAPVARISALTRCCSFSATYWRNRK